MAPLPLVDPTELDLGDAADAAVRLTARSLELVRDAAYTAVGLGVLTLQRVQVRRRELERALRR